MEAKKDKNLELSTIGTILKASFKKPPKLDEGLQEDSVKDAIIKDDEDDVE